MSSDPFAEHDAAYVLGALGADERRAFEAHLAACPRCARSVRELAGLPGLLARVSPERLPVELEPPPTVLPRLLRAVERRRRRVLAVTAAAASAAVLLAGVLAGVLAVRGTAPPGAGSTGVALTRVGSDPLRARVRLTDVAWGTRLTLVCRYGSGSYASGSYVLVVVDRRGRSQQVAAWAAVPGRVSTVKGATSWSRRDIARIEVRTTGGARVLVRRT